jgi:hypothetical protein
MLLYISTNGFSYIPTSVSRITRPEQRFQDNSDGKAPALLRTPGLPKQLPKRQTGKSK